MVRAAHISSVSAWQLPDDIAAWLSLKLCKASLTRWTVSLLVHICAHNNICTANLQTSSSRMLCISARRMKRRDDVSQSVQEEREQAKKQCVGAIYAVGA